MSTEDKVRGTENIESANLALANARSRAGKYLTFALGREEFGLQILKVREIIGLMEITAVPRTPAHVRGVINLRGQVISVIDLRRRFGMQPVPSGEHTCIIVTEANVVDPGSAGGTRKVCSGIVVDRVCEVLSILTENIEDAPDFGQSVDNRFILGMGKVGETVKILLDVDRVLSLDDTAGVTAEPRANGRAA
jgi:purine-binding chemotaxis protein CheW